MADKIYDLENVFKDGDFFKPEILNKIHNLTLDKEITLDFTMLNRFDLISYNAYGNEDLWYIIALYNNIADVTNNDKFIIKLPKLQSIIDLFS